MSLVPEGGFQSSRTLCGSDPIAESFTEKPNLVSFGPLSDPYSMEGISKALNIPTPVSSALISGLIKSSGIIAQIPDDLECLTRATDNKEKLQLGLVMLAAGSGDAVADGQRSANAYRYGSSIVNCFKSQPNQGHHCADLSSYELPEQVATQHILTERLASLGKSLHLSNTLATVVAEGFVSKRAALIDCAQASEDNTALIGLVFLAQINEEFKRPLTPKELHLRGYETGSAVISLLSDPAKFGWAARADRVIGEMHKLDT